MFTREELAAELSRLAATETPAMEIVEFGHKDFESPSSEQCIWAFRGMKREVPNGLLFWIKTLQSHHWTEKQRDAYFDSYAKAGLCEPITSAEFADLVIEYSRSLQQPLPTFLTELAGIESGLRMYSEWNDVAALVELPEAFVAFYWSTTA